MNNRTILTGLLGAGTVASATAQTPAKTKAQTPQGRPNIVIIYTDDMGIGDLSCTSTGWIETPAIDRLASQGLVLNSYYTSAPVSSPSRVGLTTGMFPMEWGINTYLQSRKGNAACEQADYLTAAAPSMARILRDAGYATGHFGKWHMGGGRDVKDAPSIPSFGFDEYCSTWESPDPAPELTATNWIWSDKDDVKRWNRTGYFVDKTLDFLVRHKDKPCFVNLWPDDMHTPWVPDEESQHKQKDWNSQPNFSEVLAEYDRQIGRFLTQLDQLGLSDNTIVIFTSEQGYSFPFGKWTCYDEGLQTGFIVRWPGVVKPGTTTDAMCEYVDVTPTLTDIAGGKTPEGLDGRSFLPVIRGKAKSFKQEVYAIQTSRGIHAGPEHYGIRSVRSDRFAYILNLTPEATFKCMSTHPKRDWWASWKEKAATDEFARGQVDRYQHRPGEELYDIVNDPFQTRNLADDPRYAAEKAALRTKLLQWMERQGDKGQQTEMEAKEHMFHKEAADTPRAKKKKTGKARPQNARNN